MVLKQFKLKSWYCSWERFIEMRETTTDFVTASTNLRWHTVGRLLTDLIQTWYYDRYCWPLHYDCSFRELDLDWRSQGCEKVKKFHATYPSNFPIDFFVRAQSFLSVYLSTSLPPSWYICLPASLSVCHSLCVCLFVVPPPSFPLTLSLLTYLPTYLPFCLTS